MTKRTEPSNNHNEALGKRVAKDFGKQGVFLGEVKSVEYDTEDEDHVADGDREDYNDTELEYACELALQISLDDEDDMQISEAHTSSGEEENYRPPKVCCH